MTLPPAPKKTDTFPNEWLAFLADIQEADPKDRLSDDLREKYSALVKSKTVICEIEFLSLLRGPMQQKEEIEEWIRDLGKDFKHGENGNCFEHELSLPICRAVIRCTGSMFKQLVESPKWIGASAGSVTPEVSDLSRSHGEVSRPRLGPAGIPGP